MIDYQNSLQEEMDNLEKTVKYLKNEVLEKTEKFHTTKRELVSLRKDMWENTVHFSNDFTKLTEINQYLAEVNIRSVDYFNQQKRLKKYKKMIDCPYFGRFDFLEKNLEREKIYIGLHDVWDLDTQEVYVYDWRAPIASIFYQYELGKAQYMSPLGEICGEVLLKRQFKIRNSNLKYFFDCSIMINDEILQEVLSRNASQKMRHIVETIQKEQDLIIRDTENELLVVQGVAGSGKTSIALHRVAFLLYEGLKTKLLANNVIIISPNTIFSNYISSVLPELGEENIEQTTFIEIAKKILNERFIVESRNGQLEVLINKANTKVAYLRKQSIKFKGSNEFKIILERLLYTLEHKMIPFADVYFNGEFIETRQQLKNLFLNNKLNLPTVKRLKRIEKRILNKVHPLQKKRYSKIEQIVQKKEGHELEIKSFSRLLSIKASQVFLEKLRKFTEVDYFKLYQRLFRDKKFFSKLAEGLELPLEIDEICTITLENLEKGNLYFEDCSPLIYLKLRLEGNEDFSEIRQVVIDEAQDYYPLQYEVFKLLFNDARYTVLGDFQQVIEKKVKRKVFDEITKIIDKNKTVMISMNKSYRSSFEISRFNQKLLNQKNDFSPFERHEAEPLVLFKEKPDKMDQAVIQDIEKFMQKGFSSVAVICKSQQQARQVQKRLINYVDVKLIEEGSAEVQKGAICLSAYMAKGLEFDVVIVYDAGQENYCNELDRQLLYIACTRALHRLTLYYTGEKSQFFA